MQAEVRKVAHFVAVAAFLTVLVVVAKAQRNEQNGHPIVDEDGLISYNVILATNKSCGVKDSCALRKTDRKMDLVDWKERNCFCDQQCRDYGDCCIDSKFYEREVQRLAPSNFSCVQMRQFGYLYMKDFCPQGFKDKEVVKRCVEGVSPIDDPFATMPVTSRVSTFTYRNFYCASCNGDVSDPVLWMPRVECESLRPADSAVENLTPSDVFRDIEFDPGTKRWGVRVDGKFHVCHVDAVFPDYAEAYLRKCRININTCPEHWKDEKVRDLCGSYSAYVYDFETGYRNVHCAICNNVTLGGLHCLLNDFSRFFNGIDFNPSAFAVLLDISPGGQNGQNTVGQISACQPGQMYDPFFKRCRDVFCLGDRPVWKDGQCVSADASEDSNKINDTTPSGDNATTSGFASCPKFILNRLDFEFDSDNNTIFVPAYNKTYKEGEFKLLKFGDGSSGVQVCAVGFDQVEKFTPLMGYISTLCILLSAVCLLLHLAATCMVPDLQNLSGKNMAGLSFALFAAYIFFLLGQFKFFQDNACVVVGAGMYYFFLAAFCWMNCMAFDVWRSLRLATSELRLSSGKQMRKFLTYSAYGWLVPAGFLAIALGLDFAGGVSSNEDFRVPLDFRPGFGVTSCWFSNRTALMIFFAAPLGFVMMSNLIFFVLSARMIYSTTEGSRKIKQNGCNPTRVDFKLYSRLALIMGLTWVVGLVVGYLDRELDPRSLQFFALWYLFIALNALQGVFIFVTFTCTKKVTDGLREQWKTLKTRRRVGKQASFSWSFSNSSTEQGKKRIIESQDSTDSHLSTSGQQLASSPNGEDP